MSEGEPDSPPTTDDVVRAAVPADAASIAEIHVASWRAAYVGIVPQTVLDRLSVDRRQQFWMQRLQSPDQTRTFVAVAGGRVVGFAGTGRPASQTNPPGTAEVETIYLLPAAWRRGIGRRLLSHAVDDLARRGFTVAILWVLTDNQRGRRFYEASGWAPDGTVQLLDFDGTPIEEMRYRLDVAARMRGSA